MGINVFDRLSQYRYNMGKLKKSILNRDKSFAAVRKDCQTVKASGKLQEPEGTTQYRRELRRQLIKRKQLRSLTDYSLLFILLLTAILIAVVITSDNNRRDGAYEAARTTKLANDANLYRSYVSIGDSHLARDEWQEAAEAYRMALRLCTECTEARQKLSVCHVFICTRTGLKCREALRYANHLTQKEPDNPLVFDMRAEIHMAIMNIHLAEADWQRADSLRSAKLIQGD